jgi:Right handed beta helix region
VSESVAREDAPAAGNVIAQNRISHPRRVHGDGGEGVAVEGGGGTLVARNVVLDARGTGIRLGLKHPPFGGNNNLVRRNVVRASGDDGFLVNKKDHHSLLKRNIATGAGDDGFDIDSRTAKLTKNRAVRNHDLGIEAVRGVSNGGGNIARHNGDPRQCTHVVCN